MRLLTTGCFHILHPGHIKLFEYIKEYYRQPAPHYIMNNKEYPPQAKLIVGINSDEYIIKKYGEVKVSLADRIYMLESIKYVDGVIVFSEDTPCALIERLKPDVFIKGPDYKNVNIPEKEVCDRLNIEFHITDQTKIYNASELIKVGEIK